MAKQEVREVSFRCKNCGHLEDSGNAGERDYPAACRNCGKGVRYNVDTGVKEYLNEENWVSLADLSPDALEAERKTTLPNGDTGYFWDPAEIKIVAHSAAPSTVPEGREPQEITREVSETLSAEDKT